MESYKYVIIGGGVAGTSTAETIRQKDSAGSIAIVSDEVHPLYSRVMLSKPNFFLGKIPFDQIWMKGADWYEENKIIFLGGKTAMALNAENKILTLDNLPSQDASARQSSQISYEKLLLAIGVRTRPWTVSGGDKKGIYSLRTMEDGKNIMEAIKTAKRAVIVGGGFIGFEMADLMQLAGLETTIILREDYFWQPTLDEVSGKMIENALTKTGIKILKNAEVTEVFGNESVEGVVLKDGTKIDCDVIITGIGVVPPSLDFAKNAGVNIGTMAPQDALNGKATSASGRSILANEFLETNLPDIWTAGDIAEYKDLLLEENIQLGNWVNAKEQGRVAGLNMAVSNNGTNEQSKEVADGRPQQEGNVGTGTKTPFRFVSFYTTSGAGVSIAFVGDVRPLPDRQIILRGSSEINSYARILIVGKELVGATLINRAGEMSTLSKLIENNVDISTHLAELSDPNFDLKSLLTK